MVTEQEQEQCFWQNSQEATEALLRVGLPAPAAVRFMWKSVPEIKWETPKGVVELGCNWPMDGGRRVFIHAPGVEVYLDAETSLETVAAHLQLVL